MLQILKQPRRAMGQHRPHHKRPRRAMGHLHQAVMVPRQQPQQIVTELQQITNTKTVYRLMAKESECYKRYNLYIVFILLLKSLSLLNKCSHSFICIKN